MKKKIKIIQILSILIIGVVSNQALAQENNKKMKLIQTGYEMVVNITPEKAWETLAIYGDIATYHDGVVSSESLNDTNNIAQLGCDRICHLDNGKRKVMVKEKIIDFSEGNYYTYEVYDWENFPLKTMFNTFGVKTNSDGETVIYQTTKYRLKPRFLTWFMKGKIKSNARIAIMSYKHYMETGEKKTSVDILKKKYKHL